VIAAVVAGYELLMRLNRAMSPSEKAFPPGHRPWWGGTFGSFGAATAAGKVLGLNKEEMTHALGYLGVAAPVPMRDAPYDGRPEGSVNCGIHAVYGPSTYSGIMAALLARGGYRGNQSVFDDPKGFWITAGTDRCDFNLLTKNLGRNYAIKETFFKRYPHCGQMHSTLYTLGEIFRKNKIRAEEIDQIIVKVPKEVPMPLIPYFEHYKPQFPYDAQFSVPCAIAYLVLEESPNISWYLEDKFKEPQVLELANKVKMKADPEADRIYRETGKYMNTVEVITRDGRHINKSSKSPWAFGSKYTLKTKNELIDKFRGLVFFTLKEEQIDELIRLTLNLEEVDDVSKLTGLFAPANV